MRVKITPAQKLLLVLVAGVFGSSRPATAQGASLPTAATNATVKTDSLPVFAKMDPSSPSLRSLAKGDAVYVDLRVDVGATYWCGVRVAGQAIRLGFVDCKALERVDAPQTASTATSGVKAPGKAQAAPAEIPLGQPCSTDSERIRRDQG